MYSELGCANNVLLLQGAFSTFLTVFSNLIKRQRNNNNVLVSQSFGLLGLSVALSHCSFEKMAVHSGAFKDTSFLPLIKLRGPKMNWKKHHTDCTNNHWVSLLFKLL